MTFSLFLFSFVLAGEKLNGDWMKYILWWSLPLLVIGLCALLIVIFNLVKMISDAKICRVPLAASNEVDITATGKLNICLEAPMFASSAGSGLHYELLNRQRDGQVVKLDRAISIMKTKSGSTVTFPVRVFQVAETGKYLLKVSGLNSQTDYSGYSLIISRPTSLKSFFYIFAIILTGLMFIAGLSLQ